jgi:hypothetical protein
MPTRNSILFFRPEFQRVVDRECRLNLELERPRNIAALIKQRDTSPNGMVVEKSATRLEEMRRKARDPARGAANTGQVTAPGLIVQVVVAPPERDRALGAERSPNQEILGDPLPGRAALDRRQR